jgi:hypothetical protein
MLHLEQIPAVKVCGLITANLQMANKLKLELKWGYTHEGTIFGRIVGTHGQTLHEQFYLGEEVLEQIEALHADFSTVLCSFMNARRINIQRRWNERGTVTLREAVLYRERGVISLVERKRTSAFSLARLLTACFN